MKIEIQDYSQVGTFVSVLRDIGLVLGGKEGNFCYTRMLVELCSYAGSYLHAVRLVCQVSVQAEDLGEDLWRELRVCRETCCQ